MDSVNKTLYIPLYGKAYVSRRGLFLNDTRAEAIWDAEGFALKGKAASKWLAFYMGIRAAVFDDWIRAHLDGDSATVILHLGCGLDSRVLRVGASGNLWFDVDFPEVIEERKRYYTETASYRMIEGDLRHGDWLSGIPEARRAVIVMEGVSMYLHSEELQVLMKNLCEHFGEIHLLTDCYSVFAARMSKYKNPVREVGVREVYGMDDPTVLQNGAIRFAGERDMTPARYVNELSGTEKMIFSRLYAGRTSKKLYRLYEYEKN